NCLITAGFILAGSTTIGNNFVCGGRTSVAGHIHVTDNVQISALTAITKSLDESGAFGGYPILKHRDAIRAYSTLPHLPEMRKMLKKIMKKLEL
ncbi:MAG: hypothetical protein CL677_09195, partial [Bdellovibrionaceae bacterium]|nr:hypothetical protein [Pseudobdellovibrionaceae bacterium]